jgi:hypothetical protein
MYSIKINSFVITHVKKIKRIPPETHTNRQATQHGCLPSLPGDRDKGIEKVYGDKKKTYFVLG